MKPKPQQQLEELVAEQDAISEMEYEIAHSYRETADLSQRLNIPRDVQGLVGLLEERKGYLQEVNLEYHYYHETCGIFTGGIAGAVGTLIATCVYGLYYGFSDISWVVSFIVTGPVLGYFIGKKIGKKEKEKFQRQKIENAPLIEALDQKLSYYETQASVGAIVLTTQKPIPNCPDIDLPGKYWLGHVNHLDGKSYLYHNFKDPVWGLEMTKCSDFEPEKVVAVLRPREYLSLEDLKALSSSGAAVLFEREEMGGWPEGCYGFLGAINASPLVENTISLYTESTCQTGQGHLIIAKNNGEFYNEGKVAPRLLVPEIKLRFIP